MRWREIIFSHSRAKIAIFCMAVFLWFFVVSSKQYVDVLHVPIHTVNLPEDKVFLQAPPPYAEVRFRGRGTSLILLDLFGDAHIDLNLAGLVSPYVLQLTVAQVHWASGIEAQPVEIVQPDSIEILLGDKNHHQP
jgi:hypothetical protein